VTQEDKETILRLHNEFRSEVARGKARVNEVFLPPAQAMAKMVRYTAGMLEDSFPRSISFFFEVETTAGYVGQGTPI
jgi:hypothetical protein